MLPFWDFEFESLAMPYLTDDYLNKIIERRIWKDKWKDKFKIDLYVLFIKLLNKYTNSLVNYMGKRKVITSYWVLNNEKDFNKVIYDTKVKAIMTDFPDRLKDALEVKEILRRRKKFKTYGNWIT